MFTVTNAPFVRIRLIIAIITISFTSISFADEDDGDWRLQVNGVDHLEFGTQFLASGVTVNWSVSLLFSIKDGVYINGTGLAELDSNVIPYSRPEGVFNCEKKAGTYVSTNGQLFETPHLRYQRFPLSGQVQFPKNKLKTVKLFHGMKYPGNYYGLLFECQTTNVLGKNWLIQGPQVSKERSSRQSITTSFENETFLVKVKQVKGVFPGTMLEIPLINDWSMKQVGAFNEREIEFHLEKLN